jgi:large subunit ribosomal protein L21e
MVRKKSIRTRGKMQLSKYFQELEAGDFVSVVREWSETCNFPERLQGRTGIVEGKRGRACVVKIKDQNKEKIFLIEPIHLKKIEHLKENDN